MSVVELAMSHPFLPKRVGAILADTRPEVDVPAVQRNPFAYVVSPMLGGAGAGGGLIVGVMVVGMLAAIAVPSFAKYRAASEDSAAANIRMQQQTDRDLERALDEVRVVRVKDEAPAPVEADAELVAPPPAEKQVERQVERQVVQAQPQRKAKAVKKRVPKRTTTTYRSTSTTNSNDNDNIF
jgi:type II secretory pathway pseudopilin PulG